MKNIYRLLLLSFTLFLSLMMVGDTSAQERSEIVINPFYLERYPDIKLQFPELLERRSATMIEYSSNVALVVSLRDQIAGRNTAFTVHFTGYSYDQAKIITENSLAEVFSSDDYLRFTHKGYKLNYRWNGNDLWVDFTFVYDLTPAQEAEVTNRVNQILATLISSGMNDEEKAKKIHDWVVLNVAYDTSLARHSIYDALFDGLAVCEGYAQSIYKLLKACGIPVRIVTGKGNGGAHAWNLVYLCSAWFHIDATWDDPVPDTPGRVRYNYYNLSDNQMAADHTWDRNDYSAQAANTTYSEGICNNQNPGYANTYYIPYFYSDDDYSSSWTGLALVNSDQQTGQVQVGYYGRSGTLIDRDNKSIAALGHTVFIAPVSSRTVGWIKIEASTNLDGLALIGQGTPPVMFDIDMKKNLHRRFLLSHLAADTSWRSIVMACNPNDTAATLSYSYYNQAGQLVATKSSSIPASGCAQDNLYALFGQSLAGSMVIESNQPITAFMLYDSLTTTWQAGLSALPLD